MSGHFLGLKKPSALRSSAALAARMAWDCRIGISLAAVSVTALLAAPTGRTPSEAESSLAACAINQFAENQRATLHSTYMPDGSTWIGKDTIALGHAAPRSIAVRLDATSTTSYRQRGIFIVPNSSGVAPKLEARIRQNCRSSVPAVAGL